MLIFAGIDGTGDFSDNDYATNFANSFVSRLWQRGDYWHRQNHYQRGPSNDGISTRSKGSNAADYVKNIYHPHMRQPGAIAPAVFLAGYSRGGAAAIRAASLLNDDKITVDCLILFDAVDRTISVEAEAIPPNVAACYHAVRDPATMSRWWFGNCGRKASLATAYTEKMFFCTHGGIGGMPWPKANADGAIDEDHDLATFNFAHSGATNVTPAMDAAVSAQVWSWINNNLAAEVAKCRTRLRNAVNVTTRDVEIVSVPGDTLNSLALRFYGDTSQWRKIHDRNRDKLEGFTPDPLNVKLGGVKLVVPDVPPGRQGDAHRNLNPRFKSSRFGPQMRPD